MELLPRAMRRSRRSVRCAQNATRCCPPLRSSLRGLRNSSAAWPLSRVCAKSLRRPRRCAGGRAAGAGAGGRDRGDARDDRRPRGRDPPARRRRAGPRAGRRRAARAAANRARRVRDHGGPAREGARPLQAAHAGDLPPRSQDRRAASRPRRAFGSPRRDPPRRQSHRREVGAGGRGRESSGSWSRSSTRAKASA